MSDKMRDEFEAWAKNNSISIDVFADGEQSAGEYYLLEAHCAWQAWRASRAAMVKDGWQLVPVEPTDEMITSSVMKFMGASSMDELNCNAGIWAARDCLTYYQSMLAAAPKP